MAPSTSWPSAPILNTLVRKHSASPTDISNSGATLTPISDQPCRLLMGSRKNTARPSIGDFPTAENMMAPQIAVSTTARNGESQDIRREGSARGMSSSMGSLRLGGRYGRPGPQPAHPLTDLLALRVGDRHRRGQAPLGNDHQAIGDLEELVEFLGNQEDRTAGVTQGQQFTADLRRRADIDPPGGLGDQQQPRASQHLAADNVLLQIA